MKTATILLTLTILTAFGCKNPDGNKILPGNEAIVRSSGQSSEIALQTSKPIRCILQDKAGNYWFGTDGDGVYLYDGKSLAHLMEKDGLCNNQVRTIQEDKLGNLWFGTGDGICRYDGKTFTKFSENESPGKVWKDEPGDLWFGSRDGACLFDGNALTCFSLPGSDKEFPPANSSTPYSVYSVLEDKSGNLWLGTEQRGVCRYNGNRFTYFTEKGLSTAAVRCIFQDKHGNLWFGDNGGGVYRYDGTTVANFTEESGLSNPDFVKSLMSKPGTLARVWTIAEDKDGNLWFGTIDAGAWRFDGKSLTNFTTKDGLGSNAVWTIYRDRAGTLWFGTDGGGVYTFDGGSFRRFTGKGNEP